MQCFPNLTELEIEIPISLERDMQIMMFLMNEVQNVDQVLDELLSQVNTSTLKSFILNLRNSENNDPIFLNDTLQHILKFSKLEYLEVFPLQGNTIVLEKNFLQNLVKNCPDLRKVQMGKLFF